MNTVTSETLKFVLDHIQPSGLCILEVGCGNGDFALAIQNLGALVTAIDTDESAVDIARKKV